jgi:hypothetical protein
MKTERITKPNFTTSWKNSVFWAVNRCTLVDILQLFGGTCCLHLQGLLYPEDTGSRYLRNAARLHGVTSQNTVIFIVTNVRTKNVSQPYTSCKYIGLPHRSVLVSTLPDINTVSRRVNEICLWKWDTSKCYRLVRSRTSHIWHNRSISPLMMVSFDEERYCGMMIESRNSFFHTLYIICRICNKCKCSRSTGSWMSYAQWRNHILFFCVPLHIILILVSGLYSGLSGRVRMVYLFSLCAGIVSSLSRQRPVNTFPRQPKTRSCINKTRAIAKATAGLTQQ